MIFSRRSRCCFAILMFAGALLLSGCVAIRAPVPALIESPRTAKDYYRRGLYYYIHNDPVSAIDEFDRAIALDPQLIDAYLHKSFCCTITLRYADVITSMTRAIELNPKVAGYYLTRASAYYMLDDGERALVDYDTAIAKDKRDRWLYFSKGNFLFLERRFQEASSSYRIFVKRSPKVMMQRFSTFLTSGLIGVMLDPMGQIKAAKANAKLRDGIKDIADLCDEIVRLQGSSSEGQEIRAGMSKRDVLKWLGVEGDRIVSGTFVNGPKDDVLVSVHGSGPAENKDLRILAIENDRLVTEKRVPLREVMDLPGTSQYNDVPINPPRSRDRVRELVQKTDRIVYEDTRRIISVTQWDGYEGKRVRVFSFDGDRLIFGIQGSRRLW